jgi:hypothetical protein
MASLKVSGFLRGMASLKVSGFIKGGLLYWTKQLHHLQ